MKPLQLLFRVLIMLAVVAGTIEAKTIYVDASNATAVGPYASWATAATDLQDALATAVPGDEVWVATGIYYPDQGGIQTPGDRNATFQLQTGVAIYGGFVGTETLRSEANPANNPTILSGDIDRDETLANNSYRVLTASNVDDTAILEGMLVTAGNADDASSADGGGGLYCDTSTPTIKKCIFLGNVGIYGGALANGNSSPTLESCVFVGNLAGEYGGAIFNFQFSTPELINCTLQGNLANYGGAIFNLSSGTILINCTLHGNRAVELGGAMVDFQNSGPELTNCIVWGNKADGATVAADNSFYQENSSPSYSYCLAEHFSEATLDGFPNSGGNNLPPLDPLFVLPVDPSIAPTFDGNLRLLMNSPAIGAGDNAINTTSTDLAGNPRIQSAKIDLGAYEYERVVRTVHVDATNVSAAPPYDSWATAANSLQDALANASAGTQIWVARGTYYPDQGNAQTAGDRNASFVLKNDVAIYGGFMGSETQLDAADPRANPTILSGNIDQDNTLANNSYHVLTAESVDATTVLQGFTIRDGNADGALDKNRRGGALHLERSSPTLIDCAFQKNQASFQGGAIYSVFAATPTLTNCSFEGNQSDFGGSIYYQGSTPTFTNCSFQGNLADSDGGAVASNSSSLTNSQPPPATFLNCSFLGNQASSEGGAIYNAFSSPVLTNCSFQGNQGIDRAGAIYNLDSSPTLTNCIIWGNQARGVTTSPSASVENNGPVSVPIYSHCLVENYSKSELDSSGASPDTNLEPSDPLFLLPVDPADTPHIAGVLALKSGSPAIGGGNNAANPATTDLAGNPRIPPGTTIDLGAYEFDPGIPVVTLEGAPTIILPFNSPWTDPGSSVTDNADTGLTATVGGDTVDSSIPGASYIITYDATDSDGNHAIQVTRNVKIPNIFFVDKGNGGSAPPYASWATAANSLQDALAAAAQGDEIWVAQGTYYPDDGNAQVPNDREATFTLGYGISVHGGFAGGETEVSSADPEAHPTILSGDIDQNTTSANNSYHVLTTGYTYSTVVLQGFTIQDGNADGTIPRESGGAFYCTRSSPMLIDCSFKANRADGDGGAIICRFDSSPTLTNCSFEGNRADRSGGAIICLSDSLPTLVNCTFKENRADVSGGAIIYVRGSSPTLLNCSFQGNQAVFSGGAIADLESSPAITNCLFQGNLAGTDGGAIHSRDSSPKLINCSFQGNQAVGVGGGIYNLNSSITLTNCIIWGNQAGAFPDSAFASLFNPDAATVGSYSHCLIENYSKEQLDAGASPDSNLEPTDPLFVLPADPATAPNPVGDLRLVSGSPAIDAGDNAANTTTTDLAGNQRIQNMIDLGAYEIDPVKEIPVITLVGNSAISLPLNSPWVEPGATATDKADGNVDVTIAGNVDSSALGAIYTITYDATDSDGNQAVQLTRTVTIVDGTPPPGTNNTLVIAVDPMTGRPKTITWTSSTSILQTSINIKVWTDIPGATSPFTIPSTADPKRFWRLRTP